METSQSEIRDLVSQAATSVAAAFWGTKDQSLQSLLLELGRNLDNLFTSLNQSDLQSRTADFTAAADLMRTKVLPGIQQLDASVEKLVKVEGAIKTALEDALKLSQATNLSFFKIVPSV